jgi:hypothetical protein
MSNRQKLLEKARNSPNNLRFGELCKLAEYYGWIPKKQKGTSHKLYVNPALKPEQGRRQNFQADGKNAKEYQVRQLLEFIDETANT